MPKGYEKNAYFYPDLFHFSVFVWLLFPRLDCNQSANHPFSPQFTVNISSVNLSSIGEQPHISGSSIKHTIGSAWVPLFPPKFQDVTISAKLSATCLHAGFDSFGNHSSLWISYPPFRALTECGLTDRFHIKSQKQHYTTITFVVQSSVRSAICYVCLPEIQLYFSAIFSPNLWRAPPLSKGT